MFITSLFRVALFSRARTLESTVSFCHTAHYWPLGGHQRSVSAQHYFSSHNPKLSHRFLHTKRKTFLQAGLGRCIVNLVPDEVRLFGLVNFSFLLLGAYFCGIKFHRDVPAGWERQCNRKYLSHEDVLFQDVT